MPTKIYADGFRLDTIDTPKEGDDLQAAAMTPKVRAALQEEGRVVTKVVAVPLTKPLLIILETKEL